MSPSRKSPESLFTPEEKAAVREYVRERKGRVHAFTELRAADRPRLAALVKQAAS